MLSYTTTITLNNTCKVYKTNNSYDTDTTVMMTLRGYGVVILHSCGISITVSRDFVQYKILYTPYWNDMDDHDDKDGIRNRIRILRIYCRK